MEAKPKPSPRTPRKIRCFITSSFIKCFVNTKNTGPIHYRKETPAIQKTTNIHQVQPTTTHYLSCKRFCCNSPVGSLGRLCKSHIKITYSSNIKRRTGAKIFTCYSTALENWLDIWIARTRRSHALSAPVWWRIWARYYMKIRKTQFDNLVMGIRGTDSGFTLPVPISRLAKSASSFKMEEGKSSGWAEWIAILKIPSASTRIRPNSLPVIVAPMSNHCF